MLHDGSSSNGSRTLLDMVLELQALGLSSRRIAHRLNESVDVVQHVARCAGSPFALTRSMIFSPISPILKRPASHELLKTLSELPMDRCRHIAADVDDSLARPCGRPCCVSQVGGLEPTRSAWCLEHHFVVYPDAQNVNVPRRVWEEE